MVPISIIIIYLKLYALSMHILKVKSRVTMYEIENSLNMRADMMDGFVADDLRYWLSEFDTEAGLAIALAQADMKVGWLMHELNDSDKRDVSGVRIAFDDWRELYKELHARIITIMKDENESGISKHNLDETRGHYIIMPFMERNGYRDGSGWWIRK